MKSIEELKLLIENTPSLDDLVLAIIYKSQEEKIPKAHGFFQQTFFKLKNKFPDLFTDLIFDESGIIPFSDELDAVLFRLESSSILSTLNPTYKKYTVMNMPELMEKSYKKFVSEKLADINESASIFSDLVKRQLELISGGNTDVKTNSVSIDGR